MGLVRPSINNHVGTHTLIGVTHVIDVHMAEVKTNPMRTLDRSGVSYIVHTYEENPKLTGSDIAHMLGEDPDRVFKTLVTMTKDKRYYVFVIPVGKELDLKKAAASVGEKSVSMMPAAQLLSVTGYVHGGCSPFCMRRPFVTVIDSSVSDGEIVYVSAGKVGYQMELSVKDFLNVGKFRVADISREASG